MSLVLDSCIADLPCGLWTRGRRGVSPATDRPTLYRAAPPLPTAGTGGFGQRRPLAAARPPPPRLFPAPFLHARPVSVSCRDMKNLTLLAALVLSVVLSTSARAADENPSGKKMLYHVVSLKFKPEAKAEQIKAVEQAF